MVEGGLCAELAGVFIEAYDLNFVVVLLHEAAQSQSESLVGTHAPVHGVERIGSDVLVDLFALPARPRHDAVFPDCFNDEAADESE